MYPYEKRMKAVLLYIKYKSANKVIQELGYPKTRFVLYEWHKQYQTKESLLFRNHNTRLYTQEEKDIAINYYLNNGCNSCKTVRDLGYPSRRLFQNWLDEALPDREKRCGYNKHLVKCSEEIKEQAVADIFTGKKTGAQVARELDCTPGTVQQWKNRLLFGKEQYVAMDNNRVSDFAEVDLLKQRIAELEAQEAEMKAKLFRMELECKVLEKAAEVVKKDQGISLEILSNREKAEVIDALRETYRLKDLLSVLRISKSSYCYQENSLKKPDKYAEIRTFVRSSFAASNHCYGYRRITRELRNEGIVVSPKVVLRLMKDEKLVARGRKRRHYSSYLGEISPAVPNLVNRNFHATEPNRLWLTDITEFSLPSGKVYLSPIIDCFDGLPVSWTIGTSPNANLVNAMLDGAISTLNEGETPIIHSDRGSHYRWPGWIERMDAAGLTRSMSKKGCSPDNSACEGFFGRLKNEMFYDYSWEGINTASFISILDDYLYWYRDKRIKMSLDGMSPSQYRRNLGLDFPDINPSNSYILAEVQPISA